MQKLNWCKGGTLVKHTEKLLTFYDNKTELLSQISNSYWMQCFDFGCQKLSNLRPSQKGP